MARLFVWSLLVIAVLFGPSYAGTVLYWAMGSWSATGIEALVWLVDVAGLTREEATALMRGSAQALLESALRG